MTKNLTPKEKEIQRAVQLTINLDMMLASQRPAARKEIEQIKAKYGLKTLKKYFYLSGIARS